MPVMNGYIPHGTTSSISVGSSPFLFVNPETWPIQVYLNGTLTGVSVVRNNAASLSLALTTATIDLNPGDSVTVTYLIQPTMSYYPH